MGDADFGLVRVPMRRAAEVEAGTDDGLPGTVLICAFHQIDSSARNVEGEVLSRVKGFEWHDQPAAKIGQQIRTAVEPPLVHRQQRIRICLHQVGHPAISGSKCEISAAGRGRP